MPKTLSDYIREARARITEITADDLADLLDDGEAPLLIDTREPYEYAVRHIPGAALIPRGVIESAADPNNARRVDALLEARDRTVVLYCDTGARSALATAVLQDMGYADVRNLAGGLKLWDAEDYDIETGEYTGTLP
ncbi:rhodanese-like domain-containing protein [Acidihalobacter ferrooxydans]|uniref:Sulfurtransferase n=1 Tax=Acidihalobacter ferrooxydans TaxID=1765967 RepID=A0A1P8UIP8_9GAMM|nr:rhodanese-like domain-containing protein [Acidihalobacter ferrooxydans]APZ43702.1 sulfurtransferase [Acidihalobacter ferrooxydans]